MGGESGEELSHHYLSLFKSQGSKVKVYRDSQTSVSNFKSQKLILENMGPPHERYINPSSGSVTTAPVAFQ